REECGIEKNLDEPLVNMVIQDSQPFIIVDYKFRKLVKALNPTNILPTRQALKAMVEDRYKESKEKAKAIVSKASASGMWTSVNTDVYLAVTCHFMNASTSLHSVVLGCSIFLRHILLKICQK
ncbi:hypothetical protein L3Q82_026836, partial [Scortum barcoo]